MLRNNTGIHRKYLRPKDEQQALVEEFFDSAHKRTFIQTNFLTIFENGKVLEYYRYCFGDWHYYRSKTVTETPCTRFIVHCSSGYEATPNKVRFISWLVNDSIWADAFITKDVEHIITRGCELRVDLPVQFVMQAAILTRYIRYPGDGRINSWCFMVDQGFHPIIALWFTHWYAINNGNIITYHNIDAHDMMWTQTHLISKDQIQRMLDNNREMFKNCIPFSIANGKYKPLCNCWTEDREELILIYYRVASTVKNVIHNLPIETDLIANRYKGFKDPSVLYNSFVSDNKLIIPS